MGENKFLYWLPTSMWGRQGLASVGMLVGFLVQWRVIIGALVSSVDSPGVPMKKIDIGRCGNATNKTVCP